MILRTSRALACTGLLTLAGLLVSTSFSWAQGGNPPPDGKKVERKDPKPTPGNKDELNRLREDVQRLQQEMQKRQQELHKNMEELQKVMQRLQQLEGAKGGFGGGGFPGAGGFFPGGGGSGKPPMGGGGAGGKPPMGGSSGGGGGFPGQPPMGGFGGVPMGGQPGGGVEQRLNNLEQKLEIILQELRGLRNDIKPRTKGPMQPLPGAGGNPGSGVPPAAGGVPAPQPPQPPFKKER